MPLLYRSAAPPLFTPLLVLACYRSDTGMIRQERSLMAFSMQGTKHQRGRRLAVGPEGTARRGPSSDVMDPEGGFGAAVFRQGDSRTPSGENF